MSFVTKSNEPHVLYHNCNKFSSVFWLIISLKCSKNTEVFSTHTKFSYLPVNKFFHVAILLTSFSSFGGLTVAIANEQVFLDYENNVLDSSNAVEPVKASEANLIGYNPDLSQLVAQNVHQELNTIAQTSLVTAVLDGELKTEAPPKPTVKAVSESTVVSEATIAIVKEFEGFRSSAYLDTDGTPVIGYGQSRINGRKVRLGDRITDTAAHIALETELATIQKEILSTVKVDLNDNQLGAITSLSFNTGVYGIKKSTLVRKLNQKDYSGAANEFLRWDKADLQGRRVKMNGLSRRRAKERQLFLTPVEPVISDRNL